MDKFIKLSLIHSQSSDGDCVLHVRADTIIRISGVSKMDRRIRAEINSVIETPSGQYAVSEAPAQIIRLLTEALSDIPASD